MITFKNITLRNFLSIGQVTQAINFDNQELTLILGENLDLGANGARNGTGKTTLIQGLAYALFGAPLNNIRKDNLINRTNGKNMLVTLEFSANGVEYKIERGRRPNVLRFYINSDLQTDKDDAQGENRETQQQIERAIGMSADMFKHVVALNTYSEPFLAMRTNDQRNIIEQLLGITLLSEKAELIKEKIRQNKDNIQQEEFQIKAVEEANKRVQEQIDSLRRRQKLWQAKHSEQLSLLVADLEELSKIDIEKELAAHKELQHWNERKQHEDAYNTLLARATAWQQKHAHELEQAETLLNEKEKFDIESELAAWEKVGEWLNAKNEQDTINKFILSQTKLLEKEKKLSDKLGIELQSLESHTCYTCGQEIHDEHHTTAITKKRKELNESSAAIKELSDALKSKSDLVKDIGSKPKTFYESEADAIRHASDLENLRKSVQEKADELNPYSDQLLELNEVEVGPKPHTHYDTERKAIEHLNTVDNLQKAIENKNAETDPYAEQVLEMESHALQEISFEKINEYSKLGDHYKFLLDLLTSKDSFVRKKIIDQNLAYLNSRLTHYLDKIGLPHTVVFKNDLSVEITELGRELDFDNLSRGERNRLILGLSFAFRDVWESLYCSINTLFIDELIDSGMDSIGVENSMSILKDMSRRRNKSIWLVSHREELAGRVPSILRVLKEGGFTSYSTTTELP